MNETLYGTMLYSTNFIQSKIKNMSCVIVSTYSTPVRPIWYKNLWKNNIYREKNKERDRGKKEGRELPIQSTGTVTK